MQNIENASEMKRLETSNNLVCVCVCLCVCVVSKPLGKCKPKIYHRYMYKKQKEIQMQW